MRMIVCLLFLLVSLGAMAQGKAKAGTEKKVIYKYKQYEKFDFDDLSVEGEDGSPGDLSINPRFQKEFKNELPYRKNFHQEMLKSLDTVK